MVVVLAVGIAVGQQDHLAHRQAAAEDFALGDLERILEVGATARLKPLNAVSHLGANLAEWPQMTEYVGLRVKRDNADVVGIVERIGPRERRLLGVTYSLIVAHCRVARVVAHRIRTIDQQIDGEWFARRGRGLRFEGYRQSFFEGAVVEFRVAQRIASNDKASAEIGDISIERLLNAVAERLGWNIGEDHGLVR